MGTDPNSLELVAAVNVAPELLLIATEGLPKSIDSNTREAAAISLLAHNFAEGIAALRALRLQLYWDWRPEVFPTVTLDEAAWLLVGFDPHKLDEPTPWNPVAKQRRFQEMRSRLECEVAAARLHPNGKAIEGFARRFKLWDVAECANRNQVASDTARDLMEALKCDRSRESASSRHHQTEKLNRRLAAHHDFVRLPGLEAKSIEAKQLTYKTQNNLRRKNTGLAANVQVNATGRDYNIGFRQFCAQKHPDMSLMGMLDSVLTQDRRDLNIRTKVGRPSKASRK